MVPPLAEQNDPVAQCYLGVCYWMGRACRQELARRRNGLREARSRLIRRRVNLGMLYEPARAVRKLCRRPVKWYRDRGTRLSGGAI